MKSNQSRVCNVKRASLKIFAQRLSQLLDFPRSFMYFDSLFTCARDNKSAEASYEDGGLPPDSLFKHLDRYSVEEVTSVCNRVLNMSFKRFKNATHTRRACVAIDINEAEYWGKENEYVHYKRGKGKNSHYLRYATISLVDTNTKCTIAVLPLKKGDDNPGIVKELLRQAQQLVKINTVLLDRGFYDYRIMKLIDEMGMTYIIPFRRTTAIKKLMEGNQEDKAHILYTLNRVHSYKYTTHLYLQKDSSVEGYVGVVSNKHVGDELIEWILEFYMKRWNIENSYKEINHYRVKTSSTKKQYRLLLYTLAHLLVNTIQLLRTVNKTFIRYYEFKKMIPLLLQIQETMNIICRISRTLTVQS